MHSNLHQWHLLNSLKTIIFLVNSADVIVFANAAAEEALETSWPHIQHCPVDKFFENKTLILESLQRCVASQGSIIIKEIAIRHAQRRFIASCSINFVSKIELTGPETIVASIEITPENCFSIIDPALDDARNETTNQTLVQGMAHEIKNPLGGIRGAAQLLAGNLRTREDKDYINIILHETERLSQLVDRMSGHIKDKRMLPINIHRILEHIVKLVNADEQSRISIKRDYDPSLPEIMGSEAALTQAFLNLTLNASQAMEHQGRITLRSRLASTVMIGARQHRQVIRIDIQDQGPGIDASISTSLFDPLISSKPQGAGLGLSITRDIINMHKGKIEFDSKPGNTTFSVYLPVKEGKK